jgi:hypothetical protein
MFKNEGVIGKHSKMAVMIQPPSFTRVGYLLVHLHNDLSKLRGCHMKGIRLKSQAGEREAGLTDESLTRL